MPATPDELAARLRSLGIATTTIEHPPLFTVEESRALRGEIPGAHCKSLFLKDHKGALWLVVALEDGAIDLKALPRMIGSGRLSFGNADLMMEVLGVTPGSVTPFAVINDHARRVTVVLDAGMMARDRLNYHPLVNTATTTIASADLAAFIRDCGHEPRIVGLSG